MKCQFCDAKAKYEATVKLLKFTAKMCEKCYDSFADKSTGKRIENNPKENP